MVSATKNVRTRAFTTTLSALQDLETVLLINVKVRLECSFIGYFQPYALFPSEFHSVCPALEFSTGILLALLFSLYIS